MTAKRKQLRFKRPIIATFLTQRLIHKRQKYHFENSDGADHIKQKKNSLTIITMSGDLGLTERNYYMGFVCGNSLRMRP